MLTTGPSRPRTGTLDWISRAAVIVLLIATTSCTGIAPTAPAPPADGSVSGAASAPGNPVDAGKALDMLATIPVKGRAPKTGYSRDKFGPAWADVDRNGCDTRNDMLRRDLSSVALKPGTKECVVLSGVLNDPYTDKPIDFVRGAETSAAVQIDHVVALSDAWQKGGEQLNADQRLAFANDPLNLLAVDGPANNAKSDGDAATWLPPNKSYRCEYVTRQISVKSSYRLWVSPAEHAAMTRVLKECAEAPAPESPAPAPAVAAYATCAAAREAGAAPVRSGQPGYSSRLDGDGDGVACE